MPRVRDLLYRFRPSGAPGAANAAGVPVDRALEQSAELEPVLALLTATERECATIVELARTEADEIREHCAQEARSTVAAARSRQGAERAAAAAQVRQGGRALTAEIALAAARQEADVRRQATRMTPVYVERVLGSVRSLTGEGVPAGDERAAAP
jgi:hypothetical protein